MEFEEGDLVRVYLRRVFYGTIIKIDKRAVCSYCVEINEEKLWFYGKDMELTERKVSDGMER